MATPERAFTALQRFGLGARPGDLSAIAGDPRGAVLAEIALDAALLDDTGLLGTPDALAAVTEVRQARRAAKQNAAPDEPPSDTAADPTPEPLPDETMAPQPAALPPGRQGRRNMAAAPNPLAPELHARLLQSAEAQVGFAERWTAFWTNHFAVAVDSSPIVRWTAGPFDREAIRPHVFGTFTDLLLAATQHPAMLRYLNNATSIGPDSRTGQKQGKGLNENHARELMELHTLGVTAGYTQADVTALANVLTGWRYGQNPRQESRFGRFVFSAAAHEPGTQTVLERVFAEDGVEQGLAALELLAGHPATATHIATKLVRHFVADTPPPELVAALAKTLTDTEGDLAEVARTLVGADAAWTAPATKVRMPAEFIFAAARALAIAPQPGPVLKAMATLGQPFFNPPSPEGFLDDAATWLAPDAMLDRLDIAQLMARNADASADPRQVADAVLGKAMSPATAEAIARADGPVQGLTILLMSPEFQRR